MIIDFHTHVFPLFLREKRETYLEKDATFGQLYSNPTAQIATTEDLLAAMDEDGVDMAVVMGIGWTDIGMATETNDYIIESVARYPKRIAGFGGVSPAWGKGSAREAERCADAGLIGIGELHPDTQRFDLTDPLIMNPLMEVVTQRGLIVTTHSSEPVGHTYVGKGRTTPEIVLRFVRNYQGANIICAHFGGGLPFYALMPEVMQFLQNSYFDTSASPFLYTQEVYSTVADLVGIDKVLFGSDFPLIRPRRVIDQIRQSKLPKPAQAAMLGGNAVTLFQSISELKPKE